LAVAHSLKSLPARTSARTTGAVSRVYGAWYAWTAPRLKQLAARTRSRHLFIIDVVGLLAASVIALGLWLGGIAEPQSIGPYLWIVGIIVASRAATNITLGLYGSSWRYASIADMGRIVACVVVGAAAAAIIVQSTMAFRPSTGIGGPPASVFWIVEMALALVVLATPRFVIRAASDLRIPGTTDQSNQAQRTLLYGAGWAGVMVARSAIREPGSAVIPVGFLDDDLDLQGRRLAGLHVFGGIDAMGRAMRKTKATTLLVTMPTATGGAVRRVVEAALGHGLLVRTVPPVTDLIDGSLDASRIRQVRVEDLLRRPLAEEHMPTIHDLFEGSTILITGAAGSIGSELARQALAVGPRRIALVDQAESPLYLIQRDLEERLAHGRSADVEISAHLADVSDRAAMTRIFGELKPDVVFHAAAYKHVPMPTDKAVWPSSIMGASKRVAEMIVADAARRLDRPYVSVRFGNVLGSNGSVIPIFQGQLERGQPLTLTDPEMTRYFMTIPEAAWLILDAAALAERGGLYVLDMGKPVRIMDIARDLIRLSGRDPDSVPIDVVGLRRGEKLHEELFYDEEGAHPTAVQKVLRAESRPPSEQVRDDVIGVRNAVRTEEAHWGSHGKSTKVALEILSESTDVVVIPVHKNGRAATNGHSAGRRQSKATVPPSADHTTEPVGARGTNGHSAPHD